MILTPSLRKLALTTHVIFSIGWIGAVLVFLALAATGLTSQEEGLVRAVYLVMDLITWWVIVPLALGGFLTGIISSIGTRWGLFQYYWVVIKLVLTLLSTIVLMIHTQPIGQLSVAAASSAPFGATLQKTQLQMVIASGAALLVLIVLTVLSVYKPRGLTRYGQRKQRKDIETLTIRPAAH
ncbi:MAG: hypothetical protein J0I20_30100 [Chloroflexi bacterium]|nr:hypothetical protein [Chloroflexota bacterium]OJV99067.1 MAG: hypothetical protein BGO39_16525 [Chloroflexi bacterium 54-19]